MLEKYQLKKRITLAPEMILGTSKLNKRLALISACGARGYMMVYLRRFLVVARIEFNLDTAAPFSCEL